MSAIDLELRLREQPRDWAAWLVYGDWLLEQGDARGELIRLEHHAAAQGRSPELGRDIDALNALHQAGWRESAPADAPVEWRHGFIVAIDLPYAEGVAETVRALLASRAARFLEALRFVAPMVGDDEEELELDEDGEIPAPQPFPEPMTALAEVDMSQLSSLALRYCLIGPEGAAALARARLPRLVELDLRYNAIGDAGAAHLAAAPLAGLTSLSLARSGLSAAGARALAESPHLGALERLDLRFNEIGAAGAAALGASPIVRRLRELLLYKADVGDDGAAALGEARELPPAIRRFWRGQ